MKFDTEFPTCREGVFVPVPFAEPEQIVHTVETAEALGYHAVWGTDFIAPTPCYGIPDTAPPNWYEPLITLAYCAARTERIKLGTGIIMLPLREPVVLAKQVATLDRLSDGRLLLGVGLGMCRDEFDAILGWRGKVHRGRLMEEHIEVLQRLLAHEEGAVTYDGEYDGIEGISLHPKPVQDPLTIYVPGHNDAALERAARLNLGVMIAAAMAENRIEALKPLLAQQGRDIADVDIIAEAELRLAATHEAAVEQYLGSRHGKFRVDIRGAEADKVVAGNWIGTADEAIEKISKVKEFGISHFNVLHIAGDSVAERLEQMRMFAEEVMPHVA
jgi:probable F420-dependent oxidoreductase